MRTTEMLKNKRGSIVVEAALVVPVVILAVVAIIYLSALLYQMAYLQSEANKAAQRGAVIWTNTARDVATGKVAQNQLNSAGLYWRFGIFDTGKTKKLNKIREYINSQKSISGKEIYKLDRFSILTSSSEDKAGRVTVELADYLVYKKVIVNIEDVYSIPLGGLLRNFGFGNGFRIYVKSEAVINEPVELIRNIDFAVDVTRELEARFEAFGDVVESSRDIMDKVKNQISELLK